MSRHTKFSNNPFAEQAHRLPERKRLLPHREKPLPRKTKRKRSQDPPEPHEPEEDWFAMQMADVAPIKRRTRREDSLPSLDALPVVDEEQEVRKELQALIQGEGCFELYYSDEYVEGISQSENPATLERLRQGDFAWQGYIDLHGLNVEEAREAISHFVDHQQKKGHRCLLVVHGRGRHSPDRIPILKRKLINWLTRGFLRKQITAFATAPTHDGGPGAMYVLLS